jgi:putative DNA primase/helicase
MENKSTKDFLRDRLAAVTNWRTIVQEIMKEVPIVYDKAGLWWMWSIERTCYELIDETDLMNIIDGVVTRTTLKSSIQVQILNAFKREGRMNTPKEVPKTWVQFKDKVVDVATGEEFNATPEYFLTNPIPHSLGSIEDTPIIDKLLNEWSGEYTTTLKQIIAYCCLRDYPLHRIFLLIGSGSNGKGTYLRLLNNFIGTENIASTEMDFLINNQFHITKLHKKLCCQMSETNFQALKNTSMLKRLSGGDLIGFEYKNKKPFDDYNYAKIIIATNSLPVTHDKTDGFYRRWVIVDFNTQFDEKTDPLINIPESEYEGLSRWVCNAIRSLLMNREFNKEGSIAHRKERYESRSNPLTSFLSENYQKEPNEMVEAGQFYDHFSNWLNGRGHRVLTYQVVRNMMKEEGYEYDKSRFGKYDNAVACIVGLKRNYLVPVVPVIPALPSPPPPHGDKPYSTGTAGTTGTMFA